jgi:hypothetical protein
MPQGRRTSSGRPEAAEPDCTATMTTNEISPPRGGRARAGGHEAAEGERGGGARRGEAPSQAALERKRTGVQGGPVIICPKQRDVNPDHGLVRQN